MTLEPVRFSSAEDILKFIEKSVSYEDPLDGFSFLLSTLLKPGIKNPYLFLSKEGAVYFIEDLKRYLEENSNETLECSKIRFRKKNGEEVNPAQLKADPELIKDLKFDEGGINYVRLWNANLYKDEPFPSLETLEQIKNAEIFYSNLKVYKTIASTILTLSLKEFFNQELFTFPIFSPIKPHLFPNERSTFHFINSLQKDFIKITLVQEIKLKKHLINEMQKRSTEPEKEALKQWIKNIESNHVSAKDLINQILKMLKEHQNLTQTTKAKYQALVKSGVTEEKAKLQKERLEKEIKQRAEQLKLSTERMNKLKPKIVSAVLIGLPLVLLTTTLTVSAFFLAAVPVLITFLTLSIILGLVMFLSKSAIKEFIENKCDAKIEKQAKNNQEIVQSYYDYLLFERTSQSIDFINTGGHHEEMIAELEAMVTEINPNPLPSVENAKVFKQTAVSNLSMFNKFIPIEKEEPSEQSNPNFAFAV